MSHFSMLTDKFLWNNQVRSTLFISLVLSFLGYCATRQVIPLLSPTFIQKGRWGKDLLKKHKPITAESMGAVVGIIFFIQCFLFIPIPFLEWIQNGSFVQELPFPFEKFARYIGGLLSLFSMLFLGFADDVLDIKWRYKIWMPLIASMPLLMVYYVTFGKTDIMLPVPLAHLLKIKILHLGPLYYVYMACLATFSTNAINIMAGLNGIEGGQSLIIAMSLAINDVIQMQCNPARLDAHLNSLYLLIPFIGVNLGYLHHNWYPAKVFGGDTFCYFSGMIFAVVGILGNFSKTVLLFMIPQIFNFLFSCPQLFHLVPCPRHRMPIFNEKTGLIEASTFELKRNSGLVGRWIIQLFAFFRLVRIEQKDEMFVISNFTIINFVLIHLGPTTEAKAVTCVLFIQLLFSLFAFWVRYGFVHVLYH